MRDDLGLGPGRLTGSPSARAGRRRVAEPVHDRAEPARRVPDRRACTQYAPPPRRGAASVRAVPRGAHRSATTSPFRSAVVHGGRATRSRPRRPRRNVGRRSRARRGSCARARRHGATSQRPPRTRTASRRGRRPRSSAERGTSIAPPQARSVWYGGSPVEGRASRSPCAAPGARGVVGLAPAYQIVPEPSRRIWEHAAPTRFGERLDERLEEPGSTFASLLRSRTCSAPPECGRPRVDAAGEAAVLGQRDESTREGPRRLPRTVPSAELLSTRTTHTRVRQRAEGAEAASVSPPAVPREHDDRHPGAHASSRR